jgi:hypothetical protein
MEEYFSFTGIIQANDPAGTMPNGFQLTSVEIARDANQFIGLPIVIEHERSDPHQVMPQDVAGTIIEAWRDPTHGHLMGKVSPCYQSLMITNN